MANLHLNCMIIDHSCDFSVSISSASTVEQLRSAINVRRGYSTPPENLTLWQVNIPNTASFVQRETAFYSLKDDNRLNLSIPLLTLFPHGAEEGVGHIVVRWQNLLTESEFVHVRLRDIIVTNRERPDTLPDGARKYPLTPRTVCLWDTFAPSVLEMQLANTPVYPMPIFHPRRTTATVTQLSSVFLTDVGAVESLPHSAETMFTYGLPCGMPDLQVCSDIENGNASTTLFPIVITMPSVLHLSNGVSFHEAYYQQGSLTMSPSGPLNRIYGYMKLNGYRYGVLSTYTQTWFLKITGEKDDLLLVSPTISRNSTTPTVHVQQCYLWLIREAAKDARMNVTRKHTARLVVTKEQAYKNFIRPRIKCVLSWDAQAAPTQSRIRMTPWTWKWQCDMEYERITIPLFRNMELLSQGERARTFRATWKGMAVIVKKADLWRQPAVTQELESEERIYHLLKRLQGRYIPRMLVAGVLDGMEMILVTGHVGTDLRNERLDTSDRDKIREALSALHNKGILHRDIRPENIVVNRDGESSRFFFIDFGLSGFTRNKKILERETKELEELLAYTPWPETTGRC
ncbi:hypothetical protein EMPS_08535 [Entomortierella parvispora]|uniref:Protein kinase domain-containing protein n=1 Tax=Entomortierella parvispora TaxID=205924 RepID=A0A9P3HGJ9_9FUNG|nr:hypothetical protein EMPS_08535 [Entomortierella parvispora]